MKQVITGSSAFSVLEVSLESGESILSQPKSMVSMTTGIEVSAKLGGVTGQTSITGSIRGLMAGESIALAIFTAKKDNQIVSLAPNSIGPILSLHLTDERDLLIAKGSFLACEPSIKLSTEFAGFKGFMAKKGLFLVRASGKGKVYLSASGDIKEKNLAHGEKIVIDNDYVVAFDSSINYKLVTASEGIKNSLLSGEGLVNRYTGPGIVYYQTRTKSKNGMIGTIFSAIS